MRKKEILNDSRLSEQIFLFQVTSMIMMVEREKKIREGANYMYEESKSER